jgi:hypothetical protein
MVPRFVKFLSIGLFVLGLTSNTVSAESIWWFGAGTDTRWNNPDNWAPGIPDGTIPLYITSSEHPGLEKVPPALIDGRVSLVLYQDHGDDRATAANIWLGGWGPELDAEHGGPSTPIQHVGELNIVGGELRLSRRSYIKVGNYGAWGIINQSSGLVNLSRGAAAIDLGWGSANSVAIYNLSGGVVWTPHLNIGTQGLGILNMTGGWVTRACVGCSSWVGAGYQIPGEDSIPGTGVLSQSGGVFETDDLVVGIGPHSTGSVWVRDTAALLVGTLQAGVDGVADLLQSGGSIRVQHRLFLGKNVDGVGSLTIRDGIFRQISRVAFQGTAGVYVGLDGRGQLIIDGSSADIGIRGLYVQGGNSELTVILDGSPTHLSPIRVGRTATFEAGAKLRVRHAADYVPVDGESVLLLSADDGVFDNGLELIGPEAEGWKLDTSQGNTVSIRRN